MSRMWPPRTCSRSVAPTETLQPARARTAEAKLPLGTQRLWPVLWLAALLGISSACGKPRTAVPEEDETVDYADDSDEDSNDDEKPTRKPTPIDEEPCAPDNPFCGDPPVEKPTEKCGTESFDLLPSGVNVVLAVDGSASMASLWTELTGAVRNMVEANGERVKLGIDLYWAEALPTFEERLERINRCGDTKHKLLDKPTADKLAETFGAAPPGPGDWFRDMTPVADPLNHYLANKTILDDPDSTNYLVLISDGNDNCFGSIFAGPTERRLTYGKLARELVKKGIRVLPIGFNGASDQINPLDGTQVKTDFTALDAIAENGGTGITKALAADDPKELQRAIEAVSKRIGNCRFRIPAALDPTQNVNSFELVFKVNGLPVERDRTGREGWNFVQGNVSEVEFYGDACEALSSGLRVEATKACDTTEVCGTAASQVSTKPRAIEFLLDRSASMADCSTGDPFGCLPGLTNGTTWWGVAATAVTSAVTAPINDDVEFGLRYFPGGANIDLFSCGVDAEPAVAPAPGTAISLISNLLSHVPTGSTPLVAGLESLVANPGRLAQPDVSGAVILVSDGGEACEMLESGVAAERLGIAARTLRERGIRVFAVRFGAMGPDFPTQDQQLRAIVKEGGTASSDPSDMSKVPYLEAPDTMALNRVLESISEELAACTLAIGELPNDADKDLVNLYLDGSLTPFDKGKTMSGGWGWLDAERTELELYGEDCARFKRSRSTSIVIEVGCEQMTLL